ncbi:uncharacterized protein LOC132044342 [Lycium ferocissimum]|uniref:uncharacterized protein LOC132044342 n=1 Tax=Lycium ferocissimum TaxID=112874 RepID=UPI002815B030|nr:uncharacterized protein LOC132044342 [Lycium ferocissimum]
MEFFAEDGDLDESIVDTIKYHEWETFVLPPGDFCLDLVLEFYKNLNEDSNESMVMGKKIDFSPESINRHFGLKPVNDDLTRIQLAVAYWEDIEGKLCPCDESEGPKREPGKRENPRQGYPIAQLTLMRQLSYQFNGIAQQFAQLVIKNDKAEDNMAERLGRIEEKMDRGFHRSEHISMQNVIYNSSLNCDFSNTMRSMGESWGFLNLPLFPVVTWVDPATTPIPQFFHQNNLQNQLLLVDEIGKPLNQFSQEEEVLESNLLDFIPERINEEQNHLLCAMPIIEEVKNDVFQLSGDSACGPDGFSSVFYKKCWNIVGADVYNVIKSFYEGQTLPKSVTHTNLVLLPKKAIINSFSDLRPISLNNFINKVISRLIHDTLEVILPSLISTNQSGFVQGRNIIEKVLQTQELVTNIRKRGKPANVVIKLDMAKAYDRVSWSFLMQVLRKMGFAEIGVKQRDPLSPAPFIMAAEVLSKSLNSLFEHDNFIGYGMPKWSTNLNHLAYADDTIIFASTDKVSLQKIIFILHEYERISGQKINADKSCYYMDKKVADGLVQEAWKGKLLSFGGKAVLISSVLQSIPVYLLSVMVPPKCVFKERHKLFNRFFWQTKDEGRSKHYLHGKSYAIQRMREG